MVLRYGEMLFFVQRVLPGWRLTRQRNLALLALGIAGVRDAHLTVAEIARAVPARTDHHSKYKRIWRFLSNPLWSPTELFPHLMRFLLKRFYPKQRVPVIIDQSTIRGRWEVLWASIPFRGRALPIAFRLFAYADISRDPEGTMHKIEDSFVRQVVQAMPKRLPILLLFDRGYARVSLFKVLDELGVEYVVRVPKNVWVQYGKAYEGILADIPVTRGAQIWWSRTLYHQKKRYTVNLAITLNATAEEPWYLATNLKRASTTVRWYERRFRCEELFRDLKDQLHLETIRIQNRQRVIRLIFGMMILYCALTLVGAIVQQRGLRKKVCQDRVSLVWLALRAIFMPWFLSHDLICHALFARCWSLSYETG